VSGNVQHLRVDANVLYYVVVTVESNVLGEQEYRLQVFEALTEPAENVNGTPVLDLAEYNVYFGYWIIQGWSPTS
jgi:hypothetical protein